MNPSSNCVSSINGEKNTKERGNNEKSKREDRMTSLPDELVTQILSLLPTKDAAAVSVLSKRMRRVFPWIASLDLDDQRLIDSFKTFALLVDSVLRASRSPYLSRFRLHFSKKDSWNHKDEEECCDLDPIRLDAWISFPTTRPLGVREIDLCFRVRNPGKLPSVLFTCETLEVLKIGVNLEVDPVCTLPFVLPNLKVVHLCSLRFSEDDFLTKLVSSCPCLEDLEVNCCKLNQGKFISISSSLKRLVFDVYRLKQWVNSDYLIFDTPNLEYLKFDDNLALRYNIKPMYALAEAHIGIVNFLEYQSLQASFQSMNSLLRSMSHVPRLSLLDIDIAALQFGEWKDLPMFPNLRYLCLGYILTQWKALLPFLRCAPILETLAFPEGFCFYQEETEEPEERQLRGTEAIFGSIGHLKRIEIAYYVGSKRELDLVTFLTRNASAFRGTGYKFT